MTSQTVGPGEFFELLWTADNAPGNYIFHCHVPHHTTNAHQSGWNGAPVGMTRIFQYEGAPEVADHYWEYEGSSDGDGGHDGEH